MKVLPIEPYLTHNFILNVHYAKRLPCIQHAFGLFERGHLVGVTTFGQPATGAIRISMFGHDSGVILMELNRLVVTTTTRNAASFLVGHAIRLLPKSVALVSYADKGKGHVGYVYQATNWYYAGSSSERTDMYSPSGHARHHAGNPEVRQFRTAKHRYWYSRDKTLVRACRWPQLPYPKGDTQRYEVNDEAVRVSIQNGVEQLRLFAALESTR